MSVYTGTVVSVALNIQATKQAGGTYAAWRLIYTDSRGEVKNITKPVTGLKFNRALEGQLKSLNPGDEITIVQEKNDAGFLDIKSITKGQAGEVPTLSQNDKQPSSTPAPSPSNRNFETSEERAQKQVYIARQSSLERAVTLYPKKSPQEIIEVAEFFKDYIFNGIESASTGSSYDDLQDDIPQ